MSDTRTNKVLEAARLADAAESGARGVKITRYSRAAKSLIARLEALEAAEREPRRPFCAEERRIAGWPTQPHLSDCPLAPLVKEADDE